MDTRVTRPVVDPRTSLALWLRAGRAQRQLTLDDVARVTKIQPRILEKLETGQLEGLPAEVFVRGFVKSFARCVGLDEGEAAERYTACAGSVATPATTAARAFVETLVAAPAREASATRAAAGTPSTALPVVTPVADELATVVEPPIPMVLGDAPDDTRHMTAITTDALIVVPEIVTSEEIPAPAKKKRAPRKKAATTGAPTTRSRKKKPTDATVLAAGSLELAAQAPELAAGSLELPAQPADPVAVGEPAEIVTAAIAPEQPQHVHMHVIEVIDHSAPLPSDEPAFAQGSERVSSPELEVPVMSAWQPTMPPIAATPSVPWKRPSTSVTKAVYVAPSLVIDDADPDLAELEREEREAAARPGPHRVSFLPPILLDRDDKSGRQGGLTLAVIILLIAATLTLSYLMRRPSVSGDGVTMAVVTSTDLA